MSVVLPQVVGATGPNSEGWPADVSEVPLQDLEGAEVMEKELPWWGRRSFDFHAKWSAIGVIIFFGATIAPLIGIIVFNTYSLVGLWAGSAYAAYLLWKGFKEMRATVPDGTMQYDEETGELYWHRNGEYCFARVEWHLSPSVGRWQR